MLTTVDGLTVLATVIGRLTKETIGKQGTVQSTVGPGSRPVFLKIQQVGNRKRLHAGAVLRVAGCPCMEVTTRPYNAAALVFL